MTNPYPMTDDKLYATQQPTSSLSAIDNGLINGSRINDDASEIRSPPEKTVLKRNLGLFSGTSFIMGVIIGKCVQY